MILYVARHGETLRKVNERVTNALLYLEKEYSGKNVLLITHGFISRNINKHYKKLSFDEMHGFRLGNCEIAQYMIYK